MVQVKTEELNRFCVRLLQGAGVCRTEAETIAGSLMEAERRGVTSHGVVCLPRYVRLMQEGQMRVNMEYRVVRSTKAAEVWDGMRSCGQVLGDAAMKRAAELAAQYGIGAVAVTQGNHFGAGAHYAMLAEKRGMIGVAMSTGCPTMAPWGGAEKAIGNNPVAVAVPTRGENPLVLDMAQSVVAAGKVTNRIKQGETEVPAGWILDRDGNPTTRLDEYASVMPLGGYKGFGMSLMIDVISGILFGGATGARAADTAEGPSFLMLAFQIEAFREKEAFLDEMEARIAELKQVRPASGRSGVQMPGEASAIRYRACKEQVEVMPEVLEELNGLAREFGIGTMEEKEE